MAIKDDPRAQMRKLRHKQEAFRKAIAEKPILQREYLAGHSTTIH